MSPVWALQIMSTYRRPRRGADAASFVCRLCGETKAADNFDLTEFTKHRSIEAEGYRCFACQEERLRPKCLRCGLQPGERLRCPVSDYMCEGCRYPNCDGCGIAKRPRRGQYAYTVKRSWRCQGCSTTCLRCGQQPGKRLQRSVDNYMCEGCRYPNCDGCGIVRRPHRTAYSYPMMHHWKCRGCSRRRSAEDVDA